MIQIGLVSALTALMIWFIDFILSGDVIQQHFIKACFFENSNYKICFSINIAVNIVRIYFSKCHLKPAIFCCFSGFARR
jgi:hypothetical protein